MSKPDFTLNNITNFGIPLAVAVGGGYALNRVAGVPYILGVPISGAAIFAVMLGEMGRNYHSYGPYTLYEWYIESTLLGVDIQQRHYIKSYEERTGLKYDK